jgi:hypothetical protein
VLEQHGVPVHTSTLLATRAEAVAYPKADVCLFVCASCGLITNSAFDAPGHDYSSSYEEVQSYSPRFRAYAADLARALVDRHALVGRDVFEIGSGRGDFLRELCMATGGAGYAVDPSFREGELDGPAADRITVVRAFFAPEHVPEGIGAIVCRHTLEHVHDVAGFLALVRRGLERAAPGAVVVFEVPDTLRVLRETAFWDVFYEHCSYFTPGSLARAFRHAGLVPERLELTFDDQYVVITARAGGHEAGAQLLLEESPDELVALADAFSRGVERARTQWNEVLSRARARGDLAVIWGAGSKGVAFLSTLDIADEIAYAVDVNPTKHGMFMPGTGHEIVAPERLAELNPSIVVVMNPAYSDEISSDLERLGVEASVLSL